MILFQNKKVNKINEQKNLENLEKLQQLQQLQNIKKIYKQNIYINLAKIQKKNTELLVKQNTNEKSVLENYILSVYGK